LPNSRQTDHQDKFVYEGCRVKVIRYHRSKKR